MPLQTLRLPALLAFTSLTAFGQTAAPSSIAPPSPAATAPQEPVAVGTAAPERFFELFQPFRTDSAALSPDGKLLAYSIRENDNLFVITVEVDNPAKVRSKVLAGTAETSTPTLQSDTREKTPARIRWMGWASPTRLIIETNANLATLSNGSWTNTSGAIFAVDADGTNGRTLVTPKDVEDTKLPLNNPSTTPDPNKIATPDIEQPRAVIAQANAADGGPTESMLIDDSNLPVDTRTPRTPTFFDYTSGKPESITIRTNDPRNYNVYFINVQTGKLDYGPKEMLADEMNVLIDRQGKQTAAIASTVRTSFPHKYLVEKKSGFGRWNELGKVAKIPGLDFTLSPANYMGERSFPIAFDEDPSVLYYSSNVGRDTYGIYALNLKTGERTGKPIESAALDLVDPAPNGFLTSNPLVFDRFTRQLIGVRFQNSIRSAIWFRPEFQEVQGQLETAFPGRSVDLTGWDEAGKRFLALIRGTTDAGGFYVFDRDTRKVSEFVRCAPWISADIAPLSITFSLPNPAGGKLSGVISIPRAVRQKPIPLIVMCANEPWLRTNSEFSTEINAIASMGFAVLQINPRGTWGFGVKHREAARAAFDEIQVQDIITVIDELAKGMPLNAKRVGIIGHDRGGYLALRAAQLRPDRFRCAIGIEPTINLAGWLAEARWTSGDSGPALTRSFFGEKILKQNPLMDNAKSITRPVFVLSYRGIDGGPTNLRYLDARTFTSAVEKPEVPVKFFDLTTDYVKGLAGARSEVMRNIEDFLNENIYAYNVKMGETQILENGPAPHEDPAPKK
ncbi:MAG: prolyl oligopeptidase family serine peptidase [Nibricoccus sp.]